jgi:fructosamine-3-kinase
MKNANELRTQLAEVFMKLKRGEMKPIEAAELANLAGKMINSAKVQVEYYAMRGDKQAPTITFLESTDLPRSEQ